ncbi:unnamed protein product [Parnassius mnemosyne]|uniref:HTH psq-type domain-containing protein n=1 Tax=Parnassius mnemosyne TaxID=213953 RepID=A0AAV1M8C6_9NEOP
MPRKYIRKSDRSRYDYDKLTEAVNAVKNGTISAYTASKQYNIPRTTIVNRVYDRKGLKSKTLGRCTALPRDVEETLAENLHVMEKSGFGLTRKEVIELVGQYVVKNNIKTPFKDGIPGEDWFIAFKNRHGLSVKKPQAVEHARRTACRPAVIYGYFDLLEKTINELGLT